MIQLDTETASNQNIYAGAVTVLTHTLPASPVEHLVAANVQVSALAASVSRALTIRLLADAQEVFKADVLFTSGSATADKVRWLAVPPLPLRGGQVITITVQSDHASDTAVTLTAYLPSHDLDYLFAFRAAEGSPTADSPIERLKTMDAGVTLANGAHGGAAATLTLQTPVEANAVQISGSTLAAQRLAGAQDAYRADAVVVVADGVDDAARGVNLATAYATAAGMTPGGAALSATNRAVVLIPPARYSLAATLVLNGEYVDLAGLGDQPEDTEVYASLGTATVRQTANDVRMRNFVIRNSGIGGGPWPQDLEIDASDNSASIYEDMRFRHPDTGVYGAYGTSNINGTWRRCKADKWSWRLAEDKVLAATMYDCEAGDDSFGGDNTGVAITGRLERCRAGIRSFGGCVWVGCNISGTLIDCEAGEKSFAIGKAFSGVAIHCRGGDSSFGATVHASYSAVFSGYAEDCVAGKGSFGGRLAGVGAFGKCAGTLVRCISRGSELSMRLEGATLEDCLLATGTVNQDGVTLLDSTSRIHNSTILVVEGGTGIPINAAAPQNVSAAGNRFNNRGVSETGLGPNVTNVGAGEPAATLLDTDALEQRLTAARAAKIDNLDATVGSRATPGDVTTAHGTTDGKVAAVAAQVDVKTSTRSSHSAADVAAAAWNRLTSALATAGSVGKYVVDYLAGIKVKTNLLTAGQVVVRAAVAQDGTIQAVRGDDYLAASGTAVHAEVPNYAGPSVAGATKVEFSIGPRPDGRPALFTTDEATAEMDGTTLVLEADLPGDDSTELPPGRYLADWQVTLAGDGAKQTPWAGLFILQADVTE